LQRKRRQEEEEEERKMGEYREIGLRLKEYPEEELIKARKLVSSFLQVPEEVEEVTSWCSNILNGVQIKIFPHELMCIFNYQVTITSPFLIKMVLHVAQWMDV